MTLNLDHPPPLRNPLLFCNPPLSPTPPPLLSSSSSDAIICLVLKNLGKWGGGSIGFLVYRPLPATLSPITLFLVSKLHYRHIVRQICFCLWLQNPRPKIDGEMWGEMERSVIEMLCIQNANGTTLNGADDNLKNKSGWFTTTPLTLQKTGN